MRQATFLDFPLKEYQDRLGRVQTLYGGGEAGCCFPYKQRQC